MAFISLLDDRARPKGSRDPLGFEMVWTHFGRKVVGNLTTITSSWQIFAVGLLGFHWVQKLCADAHPAERLQQLQTHFIRYEQLAAYLRYLAGEKDIMGITRVSKRIGGNPGKIRMGLDQDCVILSNQISYGIWGLYSTALRETGLLKGDERELTPSGYKLAQAIESQLDAEWYWQFITGKKKSVAMVDLEGECETFNRAIKQTAIRRPLIEALLKGSGKHELQMALFDACCSIDKRLLRTEHVSTLIPEIQAVSASAQLTQALKDIQDVERLLVAANRLFDYMRLRDDQSITEIAKRVAAECDFSYLSEGPELVGCSYRDDLEKLRSLLRSNEVGEALRHLIALNNKIMEGRGGAAWVEESGAGKIKVRAVSEVAAIPEQSELENSWDYDYFLTSYSSIAATAGR